MRISDWSSDVCSSDLVENRIIDVPAGLPASSLVEASNYLSARLTGRTLEEAQAEVLKELEQQRAELDQLTQRVIERGLASWGGSQSGKGGRSEEHTSEIQSLMRNSYAVFCLKKK